MSKGKNKIQLKNSLTFSFIRYFLIFQLVIFTALGFVMRTVANQMVFRSQEQQLTIIADSLEDTVSGKIRGMQNLVYAFAQNPDFVEGLEKGDYFQTDILLNKFKQMDSTIESVFIADGEGLVTASSRFNLLRVDISDREYFQETVKENRENYVDKTALISKVTGNPIIVFANPIRDKGRILGMLGVAVDLGIFGSTAVANKNIGDTGYAYVIDQSEQVIIHPDPDLITYDAGQWDFVKDAKAFNEELVFLPYTFEGVSKQAAFARIDFLDWLVITTLPDREAARLANQLTVILVMAILITSLLIIFYLFILIKLKVTNRLSSLEQLMGQAAEGVLTERGEPKGKDEMASITGSYNALIDALGGFFSGLQIRLRTLDEGGNELAGNMEETAAAVEQIQANIGSSMNQFTTQEESVSATVAAVEEMARNIDSLDQSIERQNESIVESSTAVEELIAQIRNISSSAEEAESCMKELVGSTDEGRSRLHAVAGLVTTISEKSRELESANTLISGIAARTNLLAMNAAIEAAHAGDAGRGFAVVADEIRKLAEQSTGQSAQVKQSIAQINSFIQEVVKGSEVSNQSFQDIQENIGRMEGITSEIRVSMAEQASGSHMVLDALKEMRDNAAGVMEGSREMTQGNQVILEAVGRLQDVNRNLNLAMREISSGIDEISQSVVNITRLSEQNRDSIEWVRDDASRYTI